MPVDPTYPSVYIQEAPSGVRTIPSVATSITAFVGRTRRGVVGEPVTCISQDDFDRRFGGLWSEGTVPYAVTDFFANGGSRAMIVRLFKDDGGDGVAYVTLSGLELRASARGPAGAKFSPGCWGNALKGTVTHPQDGDAIPTQTLADHYGLNKEDLFDLTIVDDDSGRREVFRNLTIDANGGELRVDRVLKEQSWLVSVALDADGDPKLPAARPARVADVVATGGNDGGLLNSAAFEGDEDKQTGVHALLKADLFNLLCVPPDSRSGTLPKAVRERAARLCHEQRALFIVDPDDSWDKNPAVAARKVKSDQLSGPVISLTNASNATLFFPRLRQRDPLAGSQIDTFPPCGAVAGVMARTDRDRGVWKAPAGLGATMNGVEELTVELSDAEIALLNPIGVNCLRSVPDVDRVVVWGTRTLRGSGQFPDDYEYVPVRRLSLFIEESLYRGTQWVVFEPNDESLWAQIRLSVGAFMQGLFRAGAFEGSIARDAFFVKCDSETTTQDDIDRGFVTIVVGFAPLRPAKFVIISIQQTLST